MSVFDKRSWTLRCNNCGAERESVTFREHPEKCSSCSPDVPPEASSESSPPSGSKFRSLSCSEMLEMLEEQRSRGPLNERGLRSERILRSANPEDFSTELVDCFIDLDLGTFGQKDLKHFTPDYLIAMLDRHPYLSNDPSKARALLRAERERQREHPRSVKSCLRCDKPLFSDTELCDGCHFRKEQEHAWEQEKMLRAMKGLPPLPGTPRWQH